ncbi:aminoacyl-tRNA hydrolase [Flavobacteriaceae bacterium UJ101]|nr:aminoacyl-tRNA hydrolase [Flavobacteriaceae bacterium UJ101]
MIQIVSFFNKLFSKKISLNEDEKNMQKFLIVGLGNKGEEYKDTRHNIGFNMVEYLAEEKDVKFESTNFGWIAKVRHKGRLFLLLKPDTYMNLSGKAVKFWMQKEKIELERVMIITDDLNLPYGTLRIKGKGSDGGHNGLKSIQQELNTAKYPRFRFGIGNKYEQGRQIDFVLGKWTEEEQEKLSERLKKGSEAILSFGLQGLARTMNFFNGQ